MNTALNEKNYSEAVVRVVHDEDPMSPREWDNLGTMKCWHRRYRLGDEPFGLWNGEDPQEFLRSLPKGSIVLPLYLYDHSGITMSTSAFSCPWDSGQVGYIYVTPEKIRKEYSVKRISRQLRERVTQYLKNEVEIYDHYLTGNVWGFVVENGPEGEHDSCFGFFGDDLAGMKEHVANELHDKLEAAWGAR